MKIHLVFYSNLLRLDPDNLLPGQVEEPGDLVVIDSKEEFEVERVLDSRI